MKVRLDENNFNENVQNGLKLVEFYAPWCTYCTRQDLVFDELPNIWVGQVNADENQNLVNDFKIQGFPTFILFKEGKILTEFSGYHDKNSLLMTLVRFIG